MTPAFILIAVTVPPVSPFGGGIERMAAHVRSVAATGDTVDIDGICLSTCTMQLAVGCVGPTALLGFHAPSWGGKAMTEAERVAWAEIIAAHYPPAIRDWYLAGPAHRRAVTTLNARQAVAMGAVACD